MMNKLSAHFQENRMEKVTRCGDDDDDSDEKSAGMTMIVCSSRGQALTICLGSSCDSSEHSSNPLIWTWLM